MTKAEFTFMMNLLLTLLDDAKQAGDPKRIVELIERVENLIKEAIKE